MLTEAELAKEAELTAEELIHRGERMLSLGRELMGMAASLAQSATVIPITAEDARQLLPQDRSVGRFGAVTEAVALNKARELGEFDTSEFSEVLGVDGPATMKWLGRLLALQPRVLVREAGKFRCLLKPPVEIWVVRQAGSVWTFDDAQDATGLSEEELTDRLGQLREKGIVTEDEGLWEYMPPAGAGPNEHPTRTPPERYPPSYEDAPVRGMPVRTKRASRRGASTPGQAQQIKNNEREWQKLQAARELRDQENRQRAASQPSRNGKSKPRFKKK